MDKLKTLYKKYEEIIIYLVVGVLTTIVSWAACFFAKTGRSALLERVGAAGIDKAPVKIDLQALAEEKKQLVEYLRSLDY